MLLIAHRGNINGPIPEKENKQSYLQAALDAGYNVECDVWLDLATDLIYLGHDEPQYLTSIDFLKHDSRILCHAKTIDTFEFLIGEGLNCFFHDVDEASMVWIPHWSNPGASAVKVWLCPGKFLNKGSNNAIVVMPEQATTINGLKYIVNNPHYAVCSDYVEKIKISSKEITDK